MPTLHDNQELEILGEHYHAHREALLAAETIGLTQLYNRFHDRADRNFRVNTMRELQREIDVAVIRAYGWDDLNLEHGYHEVPYLPENDRLRFTISERARLDVLRRLSELNHKRYEEEVAQGLHGRATSPGTRRLRAVAGQNTPTQQSSLDFDAALTNEGERLEIVSPRAHNYASPSHSIAEYLKANPGWHSKSDIVAVIGVTDRKWNASIASLIDNGIVERKGEKRGTRYSYVGGNE